MSNECKKSTAERATMPVIDPLHRRPIARCSLLMWSPALHPEPSLGIGPGGLLDEAGPLGQGLEAVGLVLVRVLGVDRFPLGKADRQAGAGDADVLVATADEVHLDAL